MTKTDREDPSTIPIDLIAPCGMNCRLCWGYIREKNTCPGCRRTQSEENQKSKYRHTCKIRNCEQITSGKIEYCSDDCESYPCDRLRQLDRRYKKKYGMSMIENLNKINEAGIRDFVRDESRKWICPECGEMICVHKPTCLSCGYKWH
jgi:hypothetical protein